MLHNTRYGKIYAKFLPHNCFYLHVSVLLNIIARAMYESFQKVEPVTMAVTPVATGLSPPLQVLF